MNVRFGGVIKYDLMIFDSTALATVRYRKSFDHTSEMLFVRPNPSVIASCWLHSGMRYREGTFPRKNDQAEGRVSKVDQVKSYE